MAFCARNLLAVFFDDPNFTDAGYSESRSVRLTSNRQNSACVLVTKSDNNGMFDAVSDPTPPPIPEDPTPPEKKEQRKFIGVKFNCCGIYVRVYVNKEGTAYEGRCPKCFRPVKFTIGSGGTDHRFFEAY